MYSLPLCSGGAESDKLFLAHKKASHLWGLCGFAPQIFFYLRLDLVNWSVLRADLSSFYPLPLVGGKHWPRLLWSGARLWNKKVNLLLVWFVGYECFLPSLVYGSQSVAFKGTGMRLDQRESSFVFN